MLVRQYNHFELVCMIPLFRDDDQQKVGHVTIEYRSMRSETGRNGRSTLLLEDSNAFVTVMVMNLLSKYVTT